MPIPADLVALLRSWLDAGDFDDDELISRSRKGNRPSGSNWRRAWRLALAKIDYPPLRSVPLGEAARRLGHSVETLVSTYIGALKGDETASNEMIDRYRTRGSG